MELENAAVSGLYPQQLQPTVKSEFRKVHFLIDRSSATTEPEPRTHRAPKQGPSLQRFSSNHLM